MRSQLRCYLVVVLAAILGIACGRPATPTSPTPGTPGDLQSSLSAAFDALTMPGNAACSISVSQHGQVVLERGRGQIVPGQPASADSLYRIASLTKPITASTVLISERAGRINRNDKINQYLAYPESAPTIDELIKHVPGLPDYLATPAYRSGRTAPSDGRNAVVAHPTVGRCPAESIQQLARRPSGRRPAAGEWPSL